MAGIFDKLADTKSSLGDLLERTFGRHEKPLSELSDGELREEIARRRRRRAASRSSAPSSRSVQHRALGGESGAMTARLRQYYANLELEPGASADDVRTAYAALMDKYHPEKHASDPDKHRTATQLAASLTEAYQAILAHIEGRS